jgi:hypothetical protein
VDGQGQRRLVEVKAVVARSIVLACMTRVARDNEIQLRGADWRSGGRRRWVRLYRRNLRLRCGAGKGVVRKRSPLAAEASGVHTRNHSHDVGNIGCRGHEIVSVVCQSDLQWRLSLDRLVLYGLGNILGLVEDVVVAATWTVSKRGPQALNRTTHGL